MDIMNFKNLFINFNLSKRDAIYILILLAYSIFIVSSNIICNLDYNIHPDVLAFLCNSLRFAGLTSNSYNSSLMYLSPVFCFLTSILFRLGLVHESAIFIVSGVFSIIGNVGLYILFKNRFNGLLSFFGVLLFTTFTAVVRFLANGTVDLPSIAVSIWILVFLVIAVNKNPKYYIICALLLILGIFTKYTVLFMIPLIVLYFFSKHNVFNTLDLLLSDRNEFKSSAISFLKSKEFKYILIACILAVILFAGISAVISSQGSGLTFITQSKDASSNFAANKYVGEYGYNDSSNYYIEHFNEALYSRDTSFTASHFMQLFGIVMAIALIMQAANIVKNRDALKELKSKSKGFNVRHLNIFMIIVMFALFIVTIFYATKNHLIANTALLAGFVIIYSLLDNLGIDKKAYSMNLLMLAWFLVYFIFFSAITIKTTRYMLTIIPPFVYFVLWAGESVIYGIENRLDSKETFIKRYTDFKPLSFDKKSNLMKLVKIAIIIGMIIVVYHALTTDLDPLSAISNEDLDATYDFIIEHDDNYKNKSILSDKLYYSRYGSWYLLKQVNYIKDNKTMDLKKNDYMLVDRVEYFNDYDLIFKSGKVHLYKYVG